jgi:hypothetical protein
VGDLRPENKIIIRRDKNNNGGCGCGGDRSSVQAGVLFFIIVVDYEIERGPGTCCSAGVALQTMYHYMPGFSGILLYILLSTRPKFEHFQCGVFFTVVVVQLKIIYSTLPAA